MAIDRHPATGTKIGSLLINPGGPGVSGVDFLPGAVAEMPADLLASFDIVGFDPPGVDRTAPITCEDGAGLDRYFSTDPESADALRVRGPGGGRSHPGSGLPGPESGRTALCEHRRRGPRPGRAPSCPRRRQADLSGLLLREPARAPPTPNCSRPTSGPWSSTASSTPPCRRSPRSTSSPQSLDAQLQAFFAACAQARPAPGTRPATPRRPSRPWWPGSAPARLPASGTSRRVGPGRGALGCRRSALLAGHVGPTWPKPSRRPPTATGPDFLALFDAYTGRQADGTYSNILEANAAVNCLDTPGPPPRRHPGRCAAHREGRRPSSGCWTCTDEVQCAVWPVPATGTVGPVRAAGSPPIVVVGSTGDPVTPYSWAQSLESRAGAAASCSPGSATAIPATGAVPASAPMSTGTSFRWPPPPAGHPLPQRLAPNWGSDDNYHLCLL